MTFYVGQKVVCVDDGYCPDARADKNAPPVSKFIAAGTIYIIRKISNRRNHLVWLMGINRLENLADGSRYSDSGFYGFRFRPLLEKKTDISIFTKMLTPNKVDA